MGKKKIELLSPAKNLEFGKTAIRYGADAVYVAGPLFGARKQAGNSISDIEELAIFAHKFDAKVYAAVNTILFENELDDARKLAFQLYEVGCDALIMQDMSFLQMEMPPIPLFASTQAHNYEISRMSFLEACGISRFILARELSLSQIGQIRNELKAELEFFVHGALCVCFSGKCYISHFEKGRSGNRGECSQLCRLKYDLLDDKGKVLQKDKYLLSTKDLNLSEYLEKLLNAGITSFKIEGRLKDLNYVKNITAFYRKKIDELLARDNDLERSSNGKHYFHFEPLPDRSFNRGFTDYFIEGRNESVINPQSPKSNGQFLGYAQNCTGKQFELETSEEIHAGDGLCFAGDADLNGFFVNKIDGKIITANKIVEIKDGAMIYRNQDIAFEKLLEQDLTERKLQIDFEILAENNKIVFSAKDKHGNSAEEVLFQTIAIELDENILKNQFSKTGGTIFEVDNIVIINNQNTATGQLDEIISLKKSVINSIRRTLIEKLENQISINYIRQKRKNILQNVIYPKQTLDYSDNVSNSQAEKFYLQHGVREIENAFELLDDNKGLVVMTTKHCLKHEIGDCPRLSFGMESTVKAADNAKSMYLQNGKRKYKLEFNCSECVMKVKSI